MDKKWLIGIMLMVLIIAAPVLSSAESVSKPITLVWGSYWPPMFEGYKVVERWFKKLEKMSNGQVKFKIYPGGTLSTQQTALYDLQAGTTDFQNISVHQFTTEFPISHEMQSFFYDYADPTLAKKVYWEAYHHFPEIKKQFSDAGTIPFCAVSPGSMQIHSKKAVRRLSDMKGLETGIAGKYLVQVVEKLGASPSAVSFLEFYPALQKGIIKACTMNNEFLKVMKLVEVTQYTTSLGGAYDPCGGSICIREETMKSLPSNIQKLFKETAEDLGVDFTKSLETANDAAKEFALDKGHEFIELPSADLEKWRAVSEEVALMHATKLDKKGLPGTEIYQYTRKIKAQLE